MTAEESDSGFALVAVLCWAILLSLCASTILEISKSQADDVKSEAMIASLKGAADAAIGRTLLALIVPNSKTLLAVDGTPATVNIDGVDICVKVNDESGKIDLNYASRPTLVAALRSIGLSHEDAESGADKILDWREPGDLRRLNGGKRDDYYRLGYNYGPRQALFRSVGELKLVMGFNDDLLARLEPMLTIFSQGSEVDAALAIPALSAAIRSPTTSTSFASYSITASSALAARRLVGHAFTVLARAKSSGYTSSRSAVVRISGNSNQPIWIYKWE